MDSSEALRRQACGERGEEIAARYVESLGWTVVGRRVRIAGGEIDVVAWDGRQLVFLEVRTRGTSSGPTAENTLGGHKRAVLCRAVRAYLALRAPPRTSARIDVVAVDGRHWRVRAHYRGAFDGE